MTSPKPGTPPGVPFDAIVVGTGPAGLVGEAGHGPSHARFLRTYPRDPTFALSPFGPAQAWS